MNLHKFVSGMLVAALMGVASPVWAADEAEIQLPRTHEQLYIDSMTDYFLSVGLTEQHARMLAKQTAPFGIEGLQDTSAALGIGQQQARMLASQLEGLNQRSEAFGTAIAGPINEN